MSPPLLDKLLLLWRRETGLDIWARQPGSPRLASFPTILKQIAVHQLADLGGMNLVYIITANCHAEIARPKAPRVPVCVCVHESRTELSTPAIYPISGRGNQAMRVYKWITVEPLCITSCAICSAISSWRTGRPIRGRRVSRETHGDISNLTLADGCFNYYRV